MWVYQCREKKISRSATPILENVLAQTPILWMTDLLFAGRCCFGERGGLYVQGRSPTTRRTPMTNRSIGSIKTIIGWLRERGVCTRPALGIYIETNPISHYVLDLSLPVNSQFMLVISRCIYILLNPRKKRPVTQKLL